MLVTIWLSQSGAPRGRQRARNVNRRTSGCRAASPHRCTSAQPRGPRRLGEGNKRCPRPALLQGTRMCSCRWKGRCGSHGPSELLSTRQVRHVLPAPYAPPPPARQAPPPPARYAPPPPRGQRQLPSLPGHRPPPTRSLGGWVGPPPTPPPSTVASIVAPPASRSPLLHPPPPAVAKGRGERAAPVAAEPEHQMAVTARAGVRMGDTGRNRCKVLPARIGAVRCDWERGRSLPANDEVGIRLWPWGVAFPHCSTAAPQSGREGLGLLTAALLLRQVSAALAMAGWRNTATSASPDSAVPPDRRPVGVAAALHTTAASCRLPRPGGAYVGQCRRREAWTHHPPGCRGRQRAPPTAASALQQ